MGNCKGWKKLHKTDGGRRSSSYSQRSYESDHGHLEAEHRASSLKKSRTNIKHKVTFFDFKGLMAPVFTCFKEDDKCSLQTKHIATYAKWLKSEGINGVLVNGVSGEGPALGLEERKTNAEFWWDAAVKYDLIMMLQIGGCPLPDVLELASHADELGVDAVICLPELFYKPQTNEQLVGYCSIVAKRCPTRPFFYYHIPRFTDVCLKMDEFCPLAEQEIPNFFGIQYASRDLEGGIKCLKPGRVVLLGSSTLLASGLLAGFDAAMMTSLTVRPDLGRAIYKAFEDDDCRKAKKLQKELNDIIVRETRTKPDETFVGAMKNWFNKEMFEGGPAGFLAGPYRKFF